MSMMMKILLMIIFIKLLMMKGINPAKIEGMVPEEKNKEDRRSAFEPSLATRYRLWWPGRKMAS